MRMLGDEAQLTTYSVFLAFSGLAVSHRVEIVIENLHVVFRSTDIAGECRHSKSRLYLICPDDYSFQDYQGSNETRVELADRSDNPWLQGAIDNHNMELAMHPAGNHLILSKIALIKAHHVLFPLFLQCILQLIPQFLCKKESTSSGLIFWFLSGRFFSTIS